MVIKMRRVFFTYSRAGRITRHRFLRAAILIAKAQALLEGRDAYVDQFDGKFTRNVRFFPKRVLKIVRGLKKPMRRRHPQKRSITSRRKRR